MAECFLRSEDARHPDILLKDQRPFQLGRGPTTKIKDPKCSRLQVELIPDYKNFIVKCVQKGGNPSKIASQLLKAGQEKTLKHKDTLVLPSSDYKYCILFNPPPAKEQQKKKRKSILHLKKTQIEKET